MYALIDKATNDILRVEPEGPILSDLKPVKWVDCGDDVTTAWTYDGETFSAPVVVPPATVIPRSVTMRQARLALLGAGLLPNVDDAVAAMTGVKGMAAKIEWEYSSEVNRDKDLVQGLALALGLSEAQLDELFEQAAAL